MNEGLVFYPVFIFNFSKHPKTPGLYSVQTHKTTNLIFEFAHTFWDTIHLVASNTLKLKWTGIGLVFSLSSFKRPICFFCFVFSIFLNNEIPVCRYRGMFNYKLQDFLLQHTHALLGEQNWTLYSELSGLTRFCCCCCVPNIPGMWRKLKMLWFWDFYFTEHAMNYFINHCFALFLNDPLKCFQGPLPGWLSL